MHADHLDRSDGRFCWADFKTRSPEGTHAFLSAVLGWGIRTGEGAGRPQTFLTSGGHDAGGLSDLSAPVYPPGLPAHTALYLAVPDLDAAIGAAVRAGATVVVPAFDLGSGGGRIATLLDPWGGAVSLWQRAGWCGWTHPPGTPALPVRLRYRGAAPQAAEVFYRDALGLDDPAAVFATAGVVAGATASAGGTATADIGSDERGWELAVGVSAIDKVAERTADHGTGRWISGARAPVPDGLELRVEELGVGE